MVSNLCTYFGADIDDVWCRVDVVLEPGGVLIHTIIDSYVKLMSKRNQQFKEGSWIIIFSDEPIMAHLTIKYAVHRSTLRVHEVRSKGTRTLKLANLHMYVKKN